MPEWSVTSVRSAIEEELDVCRQRLLRRVNRSHASRCAAAAANRNPRSSSSQHGSCAKYRCLRVWAYKRMKLQDHLARTCILLGWAVSLVVLAVPVAATGAETSVGLNMRATPLPETISLVGAAVAPESLLLECPINERRLIAPLIADVTAMVAQQGGERTRAQRADPAAIVDPATRVQVMLVHAPLDSYAIRFITMHAAPSSSGAVVSAMYDCLNLRFGGGEQMAKLGLYDATLDAPLPVYAPALGFYIGL